jgi:DNA-binding CsgD family transcriptional regulator
MFTPASYEIWASYAWAAVDVARRANLAMSEIFNRLPYDEAGLGRMRRISWDDYATIYDCIHALVGSDDHLDDLTESTYHTVFQEVRRLARAVIEPKPFVRFMNDVIGPFWNHAADFRSEDLGPDRVRLITKLRPGARGCWTFFRATVGAWRGSTRHLDLPPSEVTHYEITPDYGIYELRLPRSRTPKMLASCGLHASRALVRAAPARLIMGADEDGNLIRVNIEVGDALSERLDIVTIEWGLTRRQVAVLKLVVRGEANKEVAQALGCAENTVELHVTQLLRKANVSTRTRLIALFWSEQ